MAKVTKKLMELESCAHAAECLRTLAHPQRMRMVEILLGGECTVGELAEACGIQSHMASEHLRRMKDRGLLASRREGRRTYFRVADEGLRGIMGCVQRRFGKRRSR